MSKAVLLSAQPKWCEKICHKIGENADGTPIYEKRVEVRKTRPKVKTPFKVYIYCCKPKQILRYVWGKEDYRGIFPDEELDDKKVFCKIPDGSSPFCSTRYAGKVIGEFVCDFIRTEKEVSCGLVDAILVNASCVDAKDLIQYANGKFLYSWHISNLVIYDKPKELSEFYHKCEKMPCEGCEHLKYQRVNSQEKDWECEYFNYQIPITRPPQSWLYVEELSE